ncbi:tectonic-like complex member MKS1 [Clytia hemisphaerica]|uniref:Meckel syndrome type 1 protein n=1 Tax=Clytia hemisphaerica TaxID=252671 RepID=A0A7M5V232_9CNID
MENNSIGQYRSHDPPKNFAVRVTFWKVKPGSVIPTNRYQQNIELAEEAHELVDQYNKEEEKEEIMIHWQEKLFSSREFDHYNDPLNCISALEKKYHDDIQYIKSSQGDRPNQRIFTYIDSDTAAMLHEFSQVTLSESEHQNVLMDKMSQNRYTGSFKPQAKLNQAGLRRRNIVTNDPTQAMKSNRIISTPVKVMKFMVDVGSTNSNGVRIEDERVICTVKINANGLIVIQPDIEMDEIYTLETYHETRSVYRYQIEHASDEMSKDEKQQESKLFSELYNRHAQLMASQIGTDMALLPKRNDLFVYNFCEIVLGRDFEYDSLYVVYTLDLPDGWYTNDYESLTGVTHRCSMNKNKMANFSYPFQFQLQYTWPEENPCEFIKWPTLFFEVYSLDSWQRHRIEGYGYCQLPDIAGSTCFELDLWRPKGDSRNDEIRRFFIGGTPELEDTSYIKDLHGTDEKVSKFFFKTVSTGTLVLRINTALQSK